MTPYRHNDGGFLIDREDGRSIIVGDCGVYSLIDLVETPDLSSYEAYDEQSIQDGLLAQALLPIIQESHYTVIQKDLAEAAYNDLGRRYPGFPPIQH